MVGSDVCGVVDGEIVVGDVGVIGGFVGVFTGAEDGYSVAVGVGVGGGAWVVKLAPTVIVPFMS